MKQFGFLTFAVFVSTSVHAVYQRMPIERVQLADARAYCGEVYDPKMNWGPVGLTWKPANTNVQLIDRAYVSSCVQFTFAQPISVLFIDYRSTNRRIDDDSCVHVEGQDYCSGNPGFLVFGMVQGAWRRLLDFPQPGVVEQSVRGIFNIPQMTNKEPRLRRVLACRSGAGHAYPNIQVLSVTGYEHNIWPDRWR